MSDQPGRLEGATLDEKMHGLEHEGFLERHRIPVLVTVFGLLAAFGLLVGWNVNHSQDGEQKATAAANKAQAETYSLAQQVAAACASTKLTTAERERICERAEQISKQGPRGPQGIPGDRGLPGLPGVDGVDGKDGVNGKDGQPGPAGKDGENGTNGKDGASGPAGADGAPGPEGPQGPAGKDGEPGPMGPAGADGKDGAIGPQGPAGKDGEPPYSWVTYDAQGKEIERCQRSSNFDAAQPTYTCTRTQGSVLPTP